MDDKVIKGMICGSTKQVYQLTRLPVKKKKKKAQYTVTLEFKNLLKQNLSSRIIEKRNVSK